MNQLELPPTLSRSRSYSVSFEKTPWHPFITTSSNSKIQSNHVIGLLESLNTGSTTLPKDQQARSHVVASLIGTANQRRFDKRICSFVPTSTAANALVCLFRLLQIEISLSQYIFNNPSSEALDFSLYSYLRPYQIGINKPDDLVSTLKLFKVYGLSFLGALTAGSTPLTETQLDRILIGLKGSEWKEKSIPRIQFDEKNLPHPSSDVSLKSKSVVIEASADGKITATQSTESTQIPTIQKKKNPTLFKEDCLAAIEGYQYLKDDPRPEFKKLYLRLLEKWEYLQFKVPECSLYIQKQILSLQNPKTILKRSLEGSRNLCLTHLIHLHEFLRMMVRSPHQFIEDSDGMLEQSHQTLKSLSSFQLRLVLIGTQNSGKSSMINAFVGDNIATVRDSAATVIPVRYHHDVDLSEPFCTIRDLAPWIFLWQTLKSRLDSIQTPPLLPVFSKLDQSFQKHFENSYGAEIDIHSEDEPFRVTGRDNIRHCIRDLNDLVQVYYLSKIKLPTEAMNSLSTDSLPIVFIKFASIIPDSTILLDMPAVGSIFQSRIISNYVIKAIKHSTVTIPVLDYGQLRDVETNEIAQLCIQHCPDRFIVFVNKMDKADDTLEDIKENSLIHSMIEKQIFQHKVEPSRIILGSSLWYVASNQLKNYVKSRPAPLSSTIRPSSPVHMPVVPVVSTSSIEKNLWEATTACFGDFFGKTMIPYVANASDALLIQLANSLKSRSQMQKLFSCIQDTVFTHSAFLSMGTGLARGASFTKDILSDLNKQLTLCKNTSSDLHKKLQNQQKLVDSVSNELSKFDKTIQKSVVVQKTNFSVNIEKECGTFSTEFSNFSRSPTTSSGFWKTLVQYLIQTKFVHDSQDILLDTLFEKFKKTLGFNDKSTFSTLTEAEEAVSQVKSLVIALFKSQISEFCVSCSNEIEVLYKQLSTSLSNALSQFNITLPPLDKNRGETFKELESLQKVPDPEIQVLKQSRLFKTVTVYNVKRFDFYLSLKQLFDDYEELITKNANSILKRLMRNDIFKWTKSTLKQLRSDKLNAQTALGRFEHSQSHQQYFYWVITDWINVVEGIQNRLGQLMRQTRSTLIDLHGPPTPRRFSTNNSEMILSSIINQLFSGQTKTKQLDTLSPDSPRFSPAGFIESISLHETVQVQKGFIAPVISIGNIPNTPPLLESPIDELPSIVIDSPEAETSSKTVIPSLHHPLPTQSKAPKVIPRIKPLDLNFRKSFSSVAEAAAAAARGSAIKLVALEDVSIEEEPPLTPRNKQSSSIFDDIKQFSKKTLKRSAARKLAPIKKSAQPPSLFGILKQTLADRRSYIIGDSETETESDEEDSQGIWGY